MWRRFSCRKFHGLLRLLEAAEFLVGKRPSLDQRVVDHQAVAHDDVALRERRDIEFVRHHDDGDARFVEFLEYPHDFHARARIQITRRLVGQQYRRFVDQRAGNRDPLLLAAGELIGMMIRAVGQTDDLQRVDRVLALHRRR